MIAKIKKRKHQRYNFSISNSEPRQIDFVIFRNRYSIAYFISWCQATKAWTPLSESGYLQMNRESNRITFDPKISFTGSKMFGWEAICRTHWCSRWMLWKEYWDACFPKKKNGNKVKNERDAERWWEILNFDDHYANTFLFTITLKC